MKKVLPVMWQSEMKKRHENKKTNSNLFQGTIKRMKNGTLAVRVFLRCPLKGCKKGMYVYLCDGAAGEGQYMKNYNGKYLGDIREHSFACCKEHVQ